METIQQLRAIGLPNSTDLESGPPDKVPGLLRLLNQELKALIVEDLNDRNRHAVHWHGTGLRHRAGRQRTAARRLRRDRARQPEHRLAHPQRPHRPGLPRLCLLDLLHGIVLDRF